MEQEGTSMTTAVMELGEGVQLKVHWHDGAWHTDLRVKDFYLIQDRKIIGLEWKHMESAVRVSLMTSKNYLTNFAARMITAAESAAKALEKGREIKFKVKGEENDL
jgi:hypothetical protein